MPTDRNSEMRPGRRHGCEPSKGVACKDRTTWMLSQLAKQASLAPTMDQKAVQKVLTGALTKVIRALQSPPSKISDKNALEQVGPMILIVGLTILCWIFKDQERKKKR